MHYIIKIFLYLIFVMMSTFIAQAEDFRNAYLNHNLTETEKKMQALMVMHHMAYELESSKDVSWQEYSRIHPNLYRLHSEGELETAFLIWLRQNEIAETMSRRIKPAQTYPYKYIETYTSQETQELKFLKDEMGRLGGPFDSSDRYFSAFLLEGPKAYRKVNQQANHMISQEQMLKLYYLGLKRLDILQDYTERRLEELPSSIRRNVDDIIYQEKQILYAAVTHNEQIDVHNFKARKYIDYIKGNATDDEAKRLAELSMQTHFNVHVKRNNDFNWYYMPLDQERPETPEAYNYRAKILAEREKIRGQIHDRVFGTNQRLDRASTEIVTRPLTQAEIQAHKIRSISNKAPNAFSAIEANKGRIRTKVISKSIGHILTEIEIDRLVDIEIELEKARQSNDNINVQNLTQESLGIYRGGKQRALKSVVRNRAVGYSLTEDEVNQLVRLESEINRALKSSNYTLSQELRQQAHKISDRARQRAEENGDLYRYHIEKYRKKGNVPLTQNEIDILVASNQAQGKMRREISSLREHMNELIKLGQPWDHIMKEISDKSKFMNTKQQEHKKLRTQILSGQ